MVKSAIMSCLAPSRLSDWITLAKVRVNTLVVATTAGGYYMGERDPLDWMAMVITCAGTALVGALQIAEELADAGQPAVIVTLFPDNAYKYLSDKAVWGV